MTDILFIKTSSLGDVIHHMPALTEARRRMPSARFAWVVEEAYAPLVRLHPAVDSVVTVASRRWRGAPFSTATWHEMGEFRRALQSQTYDYVVDSQGLLRTGLMTFFARGQKHGYDVASIREAAAVPFYNVRHTVSRNLHAIDRNRAITGQSLGYLPAGGVDYGLDRAQLRDSSRKRYAVLLHASARREKEWPEENWIALGEKLTAKRVQLILPWGTDVERSRAERIAAALPGASAPTRVPLDSVARLIAGAVFVVGVDTGLLHLAAALEVPLVGIFTSTVPKLTGPVGSGPLAVAGSEGNSPTVEEVLRSLDQIGA